MSDHYRNIDGTLGHPAFDGHYTCEGRVRRWWWPFRAVQCHAPATHADDHVLSPEENVVLTFRYCDRHAPSYPTRTIPHEEETP